VDPLGAGDDFLAPHEGVVGVGERRGGGREVRVEGAGGGGVVRQEVEVCVVPFEDEAAEGFLVWGAGAGRRGLAVCPMGWNKRGLKEQEKNVRREVPNIFVCGGFDAGFVEHLDAISKAYAGSTAFRDLEVAGVGVFALDDLHPVLATFPEPLEDGDEEVLSEVDYLFPGVVNLHLKIESGEL
jgi:hypothetical protein